MRYITILTALVLALPAGTTSAFAYTISQSDAPFPTAVVNEGRGQSITLDNPGDSGDSLGSATQAYLDSFTFKFQRSNFAAGAAQYQLFVFDTLYATPGDLNAAITNGDALYASTGSFSSGEDATWTFDNALLSNGTEYLIASNGNPKNFQYRISTQTNPYTGGRSFHETFTDEWADPSNSIDAYFVAEFTTVPEPTVYAALFGLVALGIAWLKRGRRRTP